MHLRSVHRNNINNNSGSSGSLSVTRRRSSSSSSSDQQLFRRTSEPYPTASALAANFSATSFATFGGGRRTRSGDLAFGFNNIQIMSSSVGIVDQSTSVLDVSSSGAIVPSPSLTCGSSSSSSSANSAGNSHTSPYSSHGTILQSNSSFIDSTLSVHLQLGHHNMMPIAQPAASTLNTITPSSSSSPLPPHSYTPSITSSSASSTYSSLASVAADDESCTLGSACHTYATITSSLFSADTLPPRKKSPLLESSIDSSINTSVDDGGEEQQSTHHAVYTAAELLEIFNF